MSPIKPQVSVVIPTHNRALLLPRALRSVRQQDLTQIEILVVDDGSTDSTYDVVRAVASEDSRVRYLHQPNQGLASARNAGIAAASGRYVTFLDSDDEYLLSHLRLRMEFLDLREELQMIHGGLEVVNGSWMVPNFYCPGELVDLRECAVGATFFFHREIIELVGAFVHRTFGEDTEFFARALNLINVERVSWPTYRYYRDTSDSIVSAEISRITAQSGIKK